MSSNILTNTIASMKSLSDSRRPGASDLPITLLATPDSTGALNSIGTAIFNGAAAVIPPDTRTDAGLISDFRIGTYLRRQDRLNGDQASIVDGVIDFIRPAKKFSNPSSKLEIKHINKFIPIMIETEFNLFSNTANNSLDKFIVLFDSTPDNISFTKGATWQGKDVLGRPEPVQVFAGSSIKTFSLTGKFFADSPDDHIGKLKLSDALFALVTPTRTHFMPSPVRVKIGEWKSIRCHVTNVTVNYMGPWKIPYLKSDLPSAFNAKKDSNNGLNTISQEALDKTAKNIIAAHSQIPSHAPYLFEASFTFQVVSEANTVQYAEDIINNADSSSSDLIKNAQYNNKITSDEDSAIKTGAILLNSKDASGNILVLRNNSIQTIIPGSVTDNSGALRLAALTQITSGLSGETSRLLSNNAQLTKFLNKI